MKIGKIFSRYLTLFWRHFSRDTSRLSVGTQATCSTQLNQAALHCAAESLTHLQLLQYMDLDVPQTNYIREFSFLCSALFLEPLNSLSISFSLCIIWAILRLHFLGNLRVYNIDHVVPMNTNHTTLIPVTRANTLVFPEAYHQHFCVTPKRKFAACLKIKKYFLNKKSWWKAILAAPPFPLTISSDLLTSSPDRGTHII